VDRRLMACQRVDCQEPHGGLDFQAHHLPLCNEPAG
jgi:hypothetical protein